MARIALCLLALGLALPPCSGWSEEQPNVVLVVVDTLRADHLGCYGYARPTSPRLDALAAAGTRFAGAHATSSWTAPSVASILTGDYPHTHEVHLPNSRLSPQSETIAEVLRAAGYATAAFSANPVFVSRRQAFDQGFVEFETLDGGPSDSESDADIIGEGTRDVGRVKVANAKRVTDEAIAWLGRQRDAPQPLFLYAHYFDPHGGYYPPADYAERFGVPADSNLLQPDQHAFWTGAKPSPADLATLTSLYDAEIAFTDAEIGRLLDALPQARPTLVVITADHGEEFLDHGGMSHGRTLFEEMLRVPLLVAGAGVKPGIVLEQPVTIADVAPTIAELAGAPPLKGIDGISLAASVRDGREPAPRPVFADSTKANAKQDMLHRRAVLSGSLKLLQNLGGGYGLYDLTADPWEQQDLSATAADRAAPLEVMLTVRDSRKKNRSGWRRRPVPTVALSEEDKERMRALGYNP